MWAAAVAAGGERTLVKPVFGQLGLEEVIDGRRAACAAHAVVEEPPGAAARPKESERRQRYVSIGHEGDIGRPAKGAGRALGRGGRLRQAQMIGDESAAFVGDLLK